MEVSLFERLYLGLPLRYKSLQRGRQLRRKEKRKGLLKRSKKNLLKLALRDVPVDGRHAIMGVRGINPMEHLPSDLARHLNCCNLSRGRRIHAYILSSDFRASRFLAHRLVQMYSRCGCIDEAQAAFKSIANPNATSHNVLMEAYTRCGRSPECKQTFDSMSERDVVSWETLVAAFARSVRLGEAREALEKMPDRSAAAWSSLISAYAASGEIEEARLLLDRAPDPRFPDWLPIARAYAVCGDVLRARQMLDAMPWEGIIAWTAMARACAEAALLDDRHRISFDRMPERDTSSWVAMIQAYGSQGRVDEARRLFERMPNADSRAWATIILAYAQAGYAIEARVMFDKAPRKHARTWAALVTAYGVAGQTREAIAAFRRACAFGKEGSNALCEAMADVYARAGMIKEAWRVVAAMAKPPGTWTWNSIISAAAAAATATAKLELLVAAMVASGVDPDEATFDILMRRFGDDGAVEAAKQRMLDMSSDYGIRPMLGHYNCVVLSLARTGRLLDAQDLIDAMPYVPDESSWLALLAGFRAHGGNLHLGLRAAGGLERLGSR